jgi:hypothetical protein
MGLTPSFHDIIIVVGEALRMSGYPLALREMFAAFSAISPGAGFLPRPLARIRYEETPAEKTTRLLVLIIMTMWRCAGGA